MSVYGWPEFGQGSIVTEEVVPKAAYPVQIGWGQTTNGLFTFGVSKLGGTDVLAADSWSSGFTGPYDDVTAAVRDITIDRGRDNDLISMRAGTATLAMRDAAGIYNPLNPASPIAANLDTDKPVRIQSLYEGYAFPLFYGFITDIEADPSLRGSVIITAVDFLDKLDRQSPVIAAPPPAGSSDGAIIGAILDWFQWRDPAMRSLGAGDTVMAAWTRADGTQTGLGLVSEILDAERGIVFANKAGQVTYIDRKTRAVLPSVGTIDRVMTAFPVARSNSTIVNQWTVQRTDMAGNNVGVPQTWPDPTQPKTPSQVLHGVVAQTLTTAYLNSDIQALNLAQLLVIRTGSTLTGVYEIPIEIGDDQTMLQVLGRDIGDRVTMTIDPRNMAVFTGDFYIESIRHTISASRAPRHACTWRVSQLPAVQPFRFGISTFGGSDPLWY